MEKRKTRALASLVVLIGLCVGIVVASVCWSRQVTITFDVHGINAELLEYGTSQWNNYRDKIVATTLDANNQAVITIFSENFHDIFLNCSYVTNATLGDGVKIDVIGQYITYTWDSGSGTGKINFVGSPFSLNGYNVVDKTQMMYSQIKNSFDSPTGHALLVTVTPLTKEYAYAGHYYATITFALGFT